MPNEDYRKLKTNLEALSKRIDSFYDEFNQHEHTGVDSKRINENNLGGFISEIDVYNSGTQSISTASETLIQFNTENYDPGQEFDTTTRLFTAKTTGKYLVISNITYETIGSGSADRVLGIRLKKSGTTFYEAYIPATDSGVSNPKGTVGITQVIHLTDGDTIGMYAYQDTGGSKNIISGRANNFMTIKRLPNV